MSMTTIQFGDTPQFLEVQKEVSAYINHVNEIAAVILPLYDGCVVDEETNAALVEAIVHLAHVHPEHGLHSRRSLKAAGA